MTGTGPRANPDSVPSRPDAVLIAEAFESALVRCNCAAPSFVSFPATKIAEIVVATIAALPPSRRQAIAVARGHLPELVLEFVLSLIGGDTRDLQPLFTQKGGDGAAFASAADERPRARLREQKTASAAFSPVLLEDWAGHVAGQTFLEKHFAIPRSTLHWWQRNNHVVALRKGGRRHVFPLAQFIDGRPAAGIREVLSHVSDPRLAWGWLIRPLPGLGNRAPIDLLKQNRVAEVVLAAREFSSDEQLNKIDFQYLYELN